MIYKTLTSFLAATSLHATDYTRMAQEIVRDSQSQVQSSMSDARSFAESLPQEGSFYGFDVNELKAKTDEELKTFIEGKSCKKGKLVPAKASHDSPTHGSSSYQFLIFVSFGLSDSVLKALHDQAKGLGGRLVVRGLINDSFPETQARLKTLGITVDIHPVWFDEFAIQRVPTFVLKSGERFDTVSGNVSCHAALEAFQRDGELKEAATDGLTRYTLNKGGLSG